MTARVTALALLVIALAASSDRPAAADQAPGSAPSGASGAPQPLAAGWSRMDSGTTNNLTGLWGVSPTDVFAVGDGGNILHDGPK